MEITIFSYCRSVGWWRKLSSAINWTIFWIKSSRTEIVVDQLTVSETPPNPELYKSGVSHIINSLKLAVATTINLLNAALRVLQLSTILCFSSVKILLVVWDLLPSHPGTCSELDALPGRTLEDGKRVSCGNRQFCPMIELYLCTVIISGIG